MAFKRTILALLLIAGTIGFYSFSTSDDIVTKLSAQLDKWSDSHPIEKVHLHLDKPYYTAGDDIWFKAYVITGPLHRLQPDSGILNVELIDAQDSIKQSLKLQLHYGLAYGDFALPDTLHEGNYRIRAYTQYMLNAGSDYIFDKTISIGNVITNKVFTKTTFNASTQNGHSTVTADINYTDANGAPYGDKAMSYTVMLSNKVLGKGKGRTDANGNIRIILPPDNEALLKQGRIITGLAGLPDGTVYKSIPIRTMAGYADVQFFPEGGNMVNGLPTKVAFKAIGTDGLGVDIKGAVTGGNGEAVAQLNTSHLGMGTFIFTPRSGDTYIANITYPDGTKKVVPLPKAADSGYALSIIESGPDNLRIGISAKGATGRFVLAGQSGGKVYYSAKSSAGNDAFSVIVPKSKFPSGIAQFTLFSESGEPLNERLVFIQNPVDKLNLAVTTGQQSYSVRQKVKLDIAASNNEGKPAISSLSVSVTDESKVPVNENTENNIFASLLLTSDLKGYIEQPAYYFNSNTGQTRADLDALMLTQGYRRFEWKNILNDVALPNRYPSEKTFTISGKVTTPSGVPVAKGKVELVYFGNGIFNIDTLTDQSGRFAFTDMIYADSLKFLIRVRNAKNKSDVVIKMDTILSSPALNNNVAAAILMNNTVTVYAQNSKQLYYEQIKAGQGNRAIQLKEVVIKDKRIEALKHSDNLHGPGVADQVLLTKDLVDLSCSSLADCLRGRLYGVAFNADGTPVSTRSNGNMLIVIDGFPSSAEVMSNLTMGQIQSIEVLRSLSKASIYGGYSRGDTGGGIGSAVNGVLVITTKRGDEKIDQPQQVSKGIVTYRPRGIYKSRTFYSPKYDATTIQNIADLRSTVFWKPDVVTPGGKATIEYFNAGSAGTYCVVVEGIDSEGNIGRQVFRYKVE
ncbi:MAG: TonB-dependent receptor [Bacteroidota bacterium]